MPSGPRPVLGAASAPSPASGGQTCWMGFARSAWLSRGCAPAFARGFASCWALALSSSIAL
eukprot:12915487-Alexandrium_andersonii.AAC.1